VSVDTGHAHYAHVSTGAPPVDVFVRAAGARLAHVHLQDADGYADRHWAIGEGTIRWAEVFRALAESPGAPRLVLELADKGGIAASMAHLEAAGLGR
jgi:sugar phosphate isomerase/epimerase